MYKIHLPQFEGPFDLLLFFIERDELNIHDIPIAKITHDFLGYVQSMQKMNIELASEFIVVASSLMQIKARMLLPRPVLNEEGKEIDPREELVNRLLAYKQYKETVQSFVDLETLQTQRQERGNLETDKQQFLETDSADKSLVGLSLYGLMRTFKRIWEEHHYELKRPKHVIRKYPYNIETVKDSLLGEVKKEKRVDFIRWVLNRGERIFMVFSFLAILELVQRQQIGVVVGEGFNNFWIESKGE